MKKLSTLAPNELLARLYASSPLYSVSFKLAATRLSHSEGNPMLITSEFVPVGGGFCPSISSI
jgi:hypothetical protein